MIGVFDSGFGGLTVLKEVINYLPRYDYIYLGDNARAPYGNHSHNTIKTYTEQGINYLFDQGCTLIIIACNTASSQVLRELQQEHLRTPQVTNKKILGVIRPVAEEFARLTKTKIVGVVGTRSTIKFGSYEIELQKLDPKIKVFAQECPLLVPLIEEGWIGKPETRMIMRKYLRHIKSCNIDTLILGCTHYPIVLKEFRRMMGKKVLVPNPAEIVARSLVDYLKRHPEIETLLTKTQKRSFLTTDDPKRFQEMGGKFLNTPTLNVRQVNIIAE